jgi:hypothetical protein
LCFIPGFHRAYEGKFATKVRGKASSFFQDQDHVIFIDGHEFGFIDQASGLEGINFGIGDGNEMVILLIEHVRDAGIRQEVDVSLNPILKGLDLNGDFFLLDPGFVHFHLPINGFPG